MTAAAGSHRNDIPGSYKRDTHLYLGIPNTIKDNQAFMQFSAELLFDAVLS